MVVVVIAVCSKIGIWLWVLSIHKIFNEISEKSGLKTERVLTPVMESKQRGNLAQCYYPHQKALFCIVHYSWKMWLLGLMLMLILMTSHLQGGIKKAVFFWGKSHLVCQVQMGFSANCYTTHAATEQTAQFISQLGAVFIALCIMSFWFILLISEFL